MKKVETKTSADGLLRNAPARESSKEAHDDPSTDPGSNITMKFQIDIYEHGKEFAMKSGAIQPDSGDLAALESHADSMARQEVEPAFDPNASACDRARQEEYEEARASLPEVRAQANAADDEVRRREDALSALGDPPPEPVIPWVLIGFAAVVVGLSIAPTFHDFLFELDDDRISWMFSILTGATIGIVISWSLLGTFRLTSGNKAAHSLGLIGGLLFGVGLLVFRVVDVQTRTGLMKSVGLALIEVAVVVLCDWIGRGLSKQSESYVEKTAEIGRLSKLLASAEKERTYRWSAVTALKVTTASFTSHVAERRLKAGRFDAFVQNARNAVREGYTAGIAENRTRLTDSRSSDNMEE